MEHRQINKNYEKIAQELIENTAELEYIKKSNARIIYLESDSTKKNGTDGGEVYSVKKHDLEDFKVIIDKYGTDWATVAQ